MTFSNMPAYWQWYSYIDFVRYSWGALMVNQFKDANDVWSNGEHRGGATRTGERALGPGWRERGGGVCPGICPAGHSGDILTAWRALSSLQLQRPPPHRPTARLLTPVPSARLPPAPPGQTVLQYFSLDGVSLSAYVGYNSLFFLVYGLLAYLALSFIRHQKR